MVWLKRIAAIFAAVVVVVLLGGVAYFGLDAALGPKTADITNVRFAGPDGVELAGYLAQPEGDGPHPAVLMVHEWWGLREDIVEMADRLAAEGYVVLAPDAYRGKVTTQVPRALYLRLTTSQEQISADLDAAVRYLAELPQTDETRLAALGFCFGGDQTLQMGLRRPVPLAATAVFYGDLVTDAAELAPLAESAPVLGVFGRDDNLIPVAEVEAFEAQLAALDIPHTVSIYDGVGHAFVQPDAIDQGGAAAEAWDATLEFLSANLQ